MSCGERIEIWERPRKLAEENLKTLKELREKFAHIQWIDEMQRVSFEMTPDSDFVFEAEEILLEANDK